MASVQVGSEGAILTIEGDISHFNIGRRQISCYCLVVGTRHIRIATDNPQRGLTYFQYRTSSARARRLAGMLTLSAVAVFRCTDRENLVAARVMRPVGEHLGVSTSFST